MKVKTLSQGKGQGQCWWPLLTCIWAREVFMPTGTLCSHTWRNSFRLNCKHTHTHIAYRHCATLSSFKSNPRTYLFSLTRFVQTRLLKFCLTLVLHVWSWLDTCSFSFYPFVTMNACVCVCVCVRVCMCAGVFQMIYILYMYVSCMDVVFHSKAPEAIG